MDGTRLFIFADGVALHEPVFTLDADRIRYLCQLFRRHRLQFLQKLGERQHGSYQFEEWKVLPRHKERGDQERESECDQSPLPRELRLLQRLRFRGITLHQRLVEILDRCIQVVRLRLNLLLQGGNGGVGSLFQRCFRCRLLVLKPADLLLRIVEIRLKLENDALRRRRARRDVEKLLGGDLASGDRVLRLRGCGFRGLDSGLRLFHVRLQRHEARRRVLDDTMRGTSGKKNCRRSKDRKQLDVHPCG